MNHSRYGVRSHAISAFAWNINNCDKKRTENRKLNNPANNKYILDLTTRIRYTNAIKLFPRL